MSTAWSNGTRVKLAAFEQLWEKLFLEQMAPGVIPNVKPLIAAWESFLLSEGVDATSAGYPHYGRQGITGDKWLNFSADPYSQAFVNDLNRADAARRARYVPTVVWVADQYLGRERHGQGGTIVVPARALSETEFLEGIFSNVRRLLLKEKAEGLTAQYNAEIEQVKRNIEAVAAGLPGINTPLQSQPGTQNPVAGSGGPVDGNWLLDIALYTHSGMTTPAPATQQAAPVEQGAPSPGSTWLAAAQKVVDESARWKVLAVGGAAAGLALIMLTTIFGRKK